MFTIGFTGTREGMTPKQKELVVNRILEFIELYGLCRAVHGACIGADDEFGFITFNQKCTVVLRPGCDREGNTSMRGVSPFDLEHPAEHYLTRNVKIVDDCDVLLACPKENTEQNYGGTWATIKYARKVKKPTEIYWPNPKAGTAAIRYENTNGAKNVGRA